MESEATLVPKFVEFTQKMVQSLFNYTASYAVESNEMKPSETVRLYLVPIQNVCYYFLIGSDTEFQISYYEVFNQFEPVLLIYFWGSLFLSFFRHLIG